MSNNKFNRIVLTDNLIYLFREEGQVRIFPGREGLHFMEVFFVGEEGRNEHVMLELNYHHQDREFFHVPKHFWHEIVSWMRSTGFNMYESKACVAIANTEDIDTAYLDDDGTEILVIVRWKDGSMEIFSRAFAAELRLPVQEESCQD